MMYWDVFTSNPTFSQFQQNDKCASKKKKNLLGFFHIFIFLITFEFYTIVPSQNENSEFHFFHILTFIMKSTIYIILSSKDLKRKKKHYI